MKKMSRALATGLIALGLSGGTYAFFGSSLVPAAQAHMRDHPKLEAAYNSLKDAKDYLESAPSDFRGHKAEAIHAINEAMQRIALCVADEEKKASADPAPLAQHEKLRVARENLKEGRKYLEEAHADFHGHKEEAIKAIDEAIRQIDRCLEE